MIIVNIIGRVALLVLTAIWVLYVLRIVPIPSTDELILLLGIILIAQDTARYIPVGDGK